MYENSLHVNPSIRNFWTNLRKTESSFHIFKKNRNFVYFGNNLSKASYDFFEKRASDLNIDTDISHQAQNFQNILMAESGFEEQLERLAKKAVYESFGIPEDIIKAELNGDDVDLNKVEKEEQIAYSSLDRETQKLINKRILLNSIIQGSSIHAFCTLHHLVKDELNKLIPDIVGKYDSLSVGTVSSYWKIDYSKYALDPSFSQSMAIGSSKVEYNDEDKPEVICSAKTFTVLCQEMVKGGMECICLHGLQNIPEEKLKIVYSFSDRRVDEPRYIQISSEIWRRLLSFYKIYKQDNKEATIPEYIMNISLLSPDVIEDFFEGVIDNDFDKSMTIIQG